MGVTKKLGKKIHSGLKRLGQWEMKQIKNFAESQRKRAALEAEIREAERKAELQAYKKESLKQARKRGRAKARARKQQPLKVKGVAELLGWGDNEKDKKL